MINHYLPRGFRLGENMRKLPTTTLPSTSTGADATKALSFRNEFNKFWFQQMKWPSPAFGNILFFRKPL
jgi:hypothetical protein